MGATETPLLNHKGLLNGMGSTRRIFIQGAARSAGATVFTVAHGCYVPALQGYVLATYAAFDWKIKPAANFVKEL